MQRGNSQIVPRVHKRTEAADKGGGLDTGQGLRGEPAGSKGSIFEGRGGSNFLSPGNRTVVEKDMVPD